MDTIRTALIGMGYRGRQLLSLMHCIPAFHCVAVADPCLQEKTLPFPLALYDRGPDDYRRLLREQRPQLVVVASPWNFHVEHALACVEAGCHVAIEVKGGLAEGEYDSLIRLARRRGVQVFPLENALFMREVLSVYTMVQAGLFGNLVYLRGGYRHDLRDLLLDDQGRLGNRAHTESVWRARFYREDNADIYPTHGLAPLCLWAGINRRDRICRLTSLASRPAGLLQRIRQLGGDDSVTITLGDVIVTQLETERGLLLSLTHDTTLPRPRSLDFEVQGTRGIWQGDTRRIYIEGESPKETWQDDAPFVERYEHIYWQRWGTEACATDRHHGGMDYIMLRVLAEALSGGLPYPVTVYDLATWTAVTPLSRRSIAGRCTVDFPYSERG